MNIVLFWNAIKAFVMAPLWYRRHKTFVCKAGYACDWVYPYGFAPEADCPIHDPVIA